jgi:hypothetical protein
MDVERKTYHLQRIKKISIHKITNFASLSMTIPYFCQKSNILLTNPASIR